MNNRLRKAYLRKIPLQASLRGVNLIIPHDLSLLEAHAHRSPKAVQFKQVFNTKQAAEDRKREWIVNFFPV